MPGPTRIDFSICLLARSRENEAARTRALPGMEGVTRGEDERSRIATRNFSALLRALRYEMIGDGTAVGAAQAFGRLCGGLRKATAAHHAEGCWRFGLSGTCVWRSFVCGHMSTADIIFRPGRALKMVLARLGILRDERVSRGSPVAACAPARCGQRVQLLRRVAYV